MVAQFSFFIHSRHVFFFSSSFSSFLPIIISHSQWKVPSRVLRREWQIPSSCEQMQRCKKEYSQSQPRWIIKLIRSNDRWQKRKDNNFHACNYICYYARGYTNYHRLVCVNALGSWFGTFTYGVRRVLPLLDWASSPTYESFWPIPTITPWCLGRPTIDGKTARGASSPANPAWSIKHIIKFAFSARLQETRGTSETFP